MIDTITHSLPHGISLHCHVSGTAGQPLLLFLHGFPEGGFIWEAMLRRFEHTHRCVAPDLRGYGLSSQPSDVQAYRPSHLVQDLQALIQLESPESPAACVIAHDWGGAIAWNLANRYAQYLQQLLILNAPHPGAFLRELQHNPQQQASSQYMHFLRRPDAAQQLAENDWERALGFFRLPDGSMPSWLTPERQQQYRNHWALGMHGACAYYAASPLLPARGDHPGASTVTLPESMLYIEVPTHVLWGMSDPALHLALLEGLQAWVPHLRITPLPETTHWVLHERPEIVAQTLQEMLAKAI